MIPKTKKLQKQEQNDLDSQCQCCDGCKESDSNDMQDFVLHEINVCNDFVAILQSEIKLGIAMPNDDSKYKNEGIVVGIGPAVHQGLNNQIIKFGNYVMFGPRNIITRIIPNNGSYRDKSIVIVSEKNVICELPMDVEFA